MNKSIERKIIYKKLKADACMIGLRRCIGISPKIDCCTVAHSSTPVLPHIVRVRINYATFDLL